MTVTITPEEMYFGAPGTLTIGGVDCGGTTEAPKLTIGIEKFTPDIKNAKGPVKGTAIIRKVMPKLEVLINQLSALKLAWAMPGATATSSPGVGGPALGGGGDATLAADPALGATNVKVDSIANFAIDDFVVIGPAAGKTEANSEIARLTTVGTAGGAGTGLDLKTGETGGGLLVDHPITDKVTEINGTTLAADVAAGADVIKVVSVTNALVNDFVRIGDAGEYEIRKILTVGTAGAGGTGLTLDAPLLRGHDVGDWVVEVTGSGKTTFTWTPGRVGLPASSRASS